MFAPISARLASSFSRKGDHRGRNRDDHLGRDVHVIGAVGVDFHDLFPVTGGDPLFGEVAVLGQGLVRLGDDNLVLDVGGHILDLVGDDAGSLVDLAVGGLDEAVVVDPGEGREVGNQADVRAFRGLDRAHPAVVGVVDVADLEGGAVTGKAARAQRRQAALVGELGQRVVLVH